jgi:hypothetical protein
MIDTPTGIVGSIGKHLGEPRREEFPEVIHDTSRYAAIQSDSSVSGFVTAHAAVSNLFNLGKYLVSVQYYRDTRISAYSE